jgi:predicted metal-dependent phosphoesterase TrpH
MDSRTVAADLHMHTPASDGTLEVARRAAVAAERDLDTIAITDHDIIADRLTERVETVDGVSVITGVEVRADLFDTKIEILGYYVDPSHEGLQTMLSRTRGFRKERNRQLVQNLSSLTGLDFSYDQLAASAEGTLGRPHLAQRLVDEGVVSSIGSAFDKYLAEEGAAFVPMKRLDYTEVIETIHDAGGVTSLAHPGRIRANADTVKERVETLANAGLDGIEVWYPYGRETSDEYADIGAEDAHDLAERFDLLLTGGSDCHGPDTGKFRLGKCGVTRDQLNSLARETASR